MAITARILEDISVVAVTPPNALASPEPAHVFAVMGTQAAEGAKFIDDAALRVRVFTFPKGELRVIFEPNRMRIEATAPKKPEELRLGELLAKLAFELYRGNPFVRFGFNYDTTYQYDTVIPQREIMGAFLKGDALEDMTHFGFQCTFQSEKGKRRDTYFAKAVSPLELRVLANIEIDRPLPSPEEVQSLYERCYTESRSITERLNF
jgi:hypothetical protein